MKVLHKTGWILSSIFLAGAAFIAMNAAYGTSEIAKEERVIKIVAKRFSFTPNEIMLKKGENVRLEFTSLDFMHGFNIPDLNLRANLPPGQVTTVHLPAPKVGTYEFICDNFCGAGHEDMGGRIIVKD
jgi:cytochrome c oxidase subunit 2